MKLIDTNHHPEIDRQTAHALGLQFSAERGRRNLDMVYVADKLLLSKHQVQGLESGETAAFYGAKLFAQAADKYASLLEFEDKPSTTLFKHSTSDTSTTDAEPLATALLSQTKSETWPQPVKKLGFAMAGVALATAGIILWHQQNPETPSPTIKPPLPPVQIPQQADENIKPSTPASSSPELQTQIASDTIQLQFSQASWVQIVKINGQRQEKTYQPGSTLDIKPQELQALIIGNAQGVSVHAESSAISLKPYISSGSNVAKIIGESVRRLNQ